MNLTPASEAPFQNREAFQDFLGVHDEAHRAIATAGIRGGLNVRSLPPSDAFEVSDDWKLDHYQVHIEIGAVTHRAIPDLVGYDLTNEQQYYDWMSIHAQLHETHNSDLGITS